MSLSYQGTRGGEAGVATSQAILRGLTDDSGLFMPIEIPKLSLSMEEVSKMSYQETAYEVMKLSFTDSAEEELKSRTVRAYDEKFDTEVIAPLMKADGTYYLELFHGSTTAFKGMVLSILSHLMMASVKKNHAGKETVILAATSGSTGETAIARFADVEGTRIIVFYPKDGVSQTQELQAVAQKGDSTNVVAIHSSSDDARTDVKEIFADRNFGKMLAGQGFQSSSANSISIRRLVPQVVYYMYAYGKLLEGGEIVGGEVINVTIPIGNFGSILVAYFVKQMGVPAGKLICASNNNKVPYDFFTIGTYDRNQDLILANSPSVDILISSNLERLVHLSTGCNAKRTARLMVDLTQKGSYEVTANMKKRVADLVGGSVARGEDVAAAWDLCEETGYVLDIRTSVACAVYKPYQAATGDKTKMVITPTANPCKFSRDVLRVITGQEDNRDESEVVNELCHVSGVAAPRAVKETRGAQVRHGLECEADDMKDTIGQILGTQPCQKYRKVAFLKYLEIVYNT